MNEGIHEQEVQDKALARARDILRRLRDRVTSMRRRWYCGEPEDLPEGPRQTDNLATNDDEQTDLKSRSSFSSQKSTLYPKRSA